MLVLYDDWMQETTQRIIKLLGLLLLVLCLAFIASLNETKVYSGSERKNFKKRKRRATLGNRKQLRFDYILFHKDGLVFTWFGSILLRISGERKTSFYFFDQFSQPALTWDELVHFE